MIDLGIRRALRRAAAGLRSQVALLAGLAATLAGLVVAVGGPRPAPPGTGPDGLVWLIALGGLAAAAWLVRDVARAGSAADPVPWSDAGPIVDGVPESAPTDDPLSGGRLVTELARASEAASHHHEVEPGVEVVRPLLRQAYIEVAVRGGTDSRVAARELDAGSWTDDGVAAATLSADVDPPRRSWRRRLADWLFPARAVRRRTRRTVAALAAAADEAVPPVVGSDAPRTVPVHAPNLASVERGPDGRLRPHPRRGPPGPAGDGPSPAAAGDGASSLGPADDGGERG